MHCTSVGLTLRPLHVSKVTHQLHSGGTEACVLRQVRQVFTKAKVHETG